VKGSGPHGRIVRADVEGAQPGAVKPAAAVVAEAPVEGGGPCPGQGPCGGDADGLAAETVLKMYADRALRKWHWTGCAGRLRRG
jgi:pyruvate dehydrogenase E2 component (dihydrolipoamide acetyltransferase)